jgi:hypothetical protein
LLNANTLNIPRRTYIFDIQNDKSYLCLKQNGSLFSFRQELNEKQLKQLERSKEKWFYELVFMKFDEMPFKVLYADVASRPNAPTLLLWPPTSAAIPACNC